MLMKERNYRDLQKLVALEMTDTLLYITKKYCLDSPVQIDSVSCLLRCAKVSTSKAIKVFASL